MYFDLLTEIKKHKPSCVEEKNNIEKTIKFLTEGTNCFYRSNLLGHVTAGGTNY